jgi:plasmid stabilization system protein ParE
VKPVRLLPAAEEELIGAAQWYESRAAGLGERFLAEAIDAFVAIEKHPERFAIARTSAGNSIRRKLLDHFPYAIVYQLGEDECLVVAVAHASRRPGYWRQRLE